MTKAAKADANSTGTIKVDYDFTEFFNSPSWKKTRAKALAYDPLKGVKHIAKAPPSPNHGTKASERIAKRANFFVGKVAIGQAHIKSTPKAKVEVSIGHAKLVSAPKSEAKPKKVATAKDQGSHLDFFKSPSFLKMRKKALAYDPFKGARHIAKAPPASAVSHAAVLRNSKLAKAKKTKPQPSLTAAYVSRPGQVPQFEPARVVKNQAQLNDLIAKGNLDLLSAIAYCDRSGEVHTGSVLEIYSMLPSA